MKFVEGHYAWCMDCRTRIFVMARYTQEEDRWFDENSIEYPALRLRHPCCGVVISWMFNIPVRSQECR